MIYRYAAVDVFKNLLTYVYMFILFRKTLRNRKSLNSSLDSVDRRKSRRHVSGNPCVQIPLLMERLDINPPLPKPNKLPHPGMHKYIYNSYVSFYYCFLSNQFYSIYF